MDETEDFTGMEKSSGDFIELNDIEFLTFRILKIEVIK